MAKIISENGVNCRPRRVSKTPRALSAVFFPTRSVCGHFPDRFWYKYPLGNCTNGLKSYPEMRPISDSAESRRLRAHFPQCFSPIRSVFGQFPGIFRYKYSLGNAPPAQNHIRKCGQFPIPQSLADSAHTSRSVFRPSAVFSDASRAFLWYKYQSGGLPRRLKILSGNAVNFRFRRATQTQRTLSAAFFANPLCFSGSFRTFFGINILWETPIGPKHYPEMWSVSDSAESRRLRARSPQCFSPVRSVFGHFPDRYWYKYSSGNIPSPRNPIRKCGKFPIP